MKALAVATGSWNTRAPASGASGRDGGGVARPRIATCTPPTFCRAYGVNTSRPSLANTTFAASQGNWAWSSMPRRRLTPWANSRPPTTMALQPRALRIAMLGSGRFGLSWAHT